jgi:hypothetical protein
MAGSDNLDMVPTPADPTIDLLSTAERLRQVRTACRRFLMLWAMSPASEFTPTAWENLKLNGVVDDPEALLRSISKSHNKDWSFLFRGSVLDD